METLGLAQVRSPEEFLQLVGALLVGTGKTSRAIEAQTMVSNSVIHGLLKGTGRFPSEDTVRQLATTYAPRDVAAWLSARARADEQRARRGTRDVVDVLQGQVAVLQEQLDEALARIDDLAARYDADRAGAVEAARLCAAAEDKARRGRVKRRAAQARRAFIAGLYPTLETDFTFGYRGFLRREVDAFLVQLRALGREDMAKVDDFLTAHPGFTTAPTGRQQILQPEVVYDADDVEALLARLRIDVMEYFHRVDQAYEESTMPSR